MGTHSSALFLWIVSGCRKKQHSVAAPASAVCSQKMSRQERKVTIIPPMKGPRAGPIKVPERNQPSAVARSVGLYISPMTAEPMTRKAVPWNAVKILKTKNEAKLGAKAVPMENAVKRVALATLT